MPPITGKYDSDFLNRISHHYGPIHQCWSMAQALSGAVSHREVVSACGNIFSCLQYFHEVGVMKKMLLKVLWKEFNFVIAVKRKIHSRKILKTRLCWTGMDCEKRVFFVIWGMIDIVWEWNSQNYRYWCYTNSRVIHEVPLHDRVEVRGMLSAHKIVGTAFFEETNSCLCVELLMTQFRHVTCEEKVYFLFEKLKIIF